MADTTDHSAPAGYDLYAGYCDGHYQSYPYLKAQHGDRVVSINVFPSHTDGQVLDVETGDATPAQAPGWVKAKGSSRYQLWVAAYGVSRCPVASAVAWQKQDHGPHGENIDVSEVYDDGWPHKDIPTIYCPASSAAAVVSACKAAGLTLVPPGSVPPTPSPKGKILYRFTHKGYSYLTDGVWYRWIGSGQESKFYDGKVTDWGEVPDVVFNALVPWNANPSPQVPGPSFP